VCADPKNEKRIGPTSAFEIGSVSKTMSSTLLANLIVQGKVSLEDPLQKYLPKGVTAPQFSGEAILLKHLVTHTSGLPAVPDFSTSPADNPYANVDEASIYKTLSSSRLSRAPGSQMEYSNYASMLLSTIVAKQYGVDFESALKQQLFQPLSMQRSYVNQKTKDTNAAQGHTPNGKSTVAWSFNTNLSGVGGVRSTLDDMVAYAKAQLNPAATSIAKSIELTQQRVSVPGNQGTGMNWMLAPLNGRELLAHEGGTGGFSSFVAVDKTKKRAVVILSDTAMTNTGGLGSLGLHLLDNKVSLGKPRTVQTPSAELLKALVGQYKINNVMQMAITQENGKLYTQTEGQPKFEMAYDSAGDFYPLEFDAILRPKKLSNGSYQLSLLQGGGGFPLERIDQSKSVVTAADLNDYAGKYPLAPGFVLSVFAEENTLKAQATGQGAFSLTPAGKDVFSASAYDIEIVFERDKQGKVSGLVLKQGGQNTPARKQ
jgi:serine-type D-Ala-D-Ala carboxypeptidase/endopeptidase